MKFRKKPVVIEATQYEFGKPWPEGCVGLPDDQTHQDPRCVWIETLEGGHVVSPGDWVITGVKGERYPCKPDIFEMTYEAVIPGKTVGLDAMRWIEVQPTPDGEAHVVRVLGPHEDTRDPDPDRWVCFRVEGPKLDAECLADELADIIGDIEAVARDDGDAVPDAPPGTPPKWPEPGDVSPSGLRRVPCGESKPSASGPHAIVFNKSCRACGGKGVNAIGSLCPYCIRLVPMRPATESTGMESAKRLLIDAITAVDSLGFRIELEDAANIEGSVFNLFAEIGRIRLVPEAGNR